MRGSCGVWPSIELFHLRRQLTGGEFKVKNTTSRGRLGGRRSMQEQRSHGQDAAPTDRADNLSITLSRGHDGLACNLPVPMGTIEDAQSTIGVSAVVEMKFFLMLPFSGALCGASLSAQ
jgi:hypothetical protein